MRVIFRLPFVGAVSLFLVAQTATAQVAGNRSCRDDNGTDRCAEAQQRQVRESFGVRSIEEHRNAGDQVRRVFYVDGYGRDLILIAFVRAPGRDPALWVHYPRREGEARPESLQAPVPQAAWNEVVQRSENFDRTFAPRAGEDPELRSFCLHGWVYTIESVGRNGGPRLPAEIRRKTESACEDGPGAAYARDVERIALTLIPHCAALNPEYHRNPSSILSACRILHGDRLAAAEVLNLAHGFLHIGGPEHAHRIQSLFAHEVSIDWSGERYRGDSLGAPAFWTARLDQEDSGHTNLIVASVDAESADRVRLRGTLRRSVDGPRGRGNSSQEARVELIWTRDLNSEMKVESAMVGPWQPDPPR